MRGKQIITDMNHDRVEVEVFPALRLLRAYELHKSETPLTGFQGFGVAITGASCYELSRMDEDRRQALLKQVYTAEGANLSVGRLSIGACDYTAELYSYDDVEDDVELKHFSIERDMRYVVPMIKEILKVRPDLFLLASPWSPPYWMKTGGNMCGAVSKYQGGHGVRGVTKAGAVYCGKVKKYMAQKAPSYAAPVQVAEAEKSRS